MFHCLNRSPNPVAVVFIGQTPGGLRRRCCRWQRLAPGQERARLCRWPRRPGTRRALGVWCPRRRAAAGPGAAQGGAAGRRGQMGPRSSVHGRGGRRPTGRQGPCSGHAGQPRVGVCAHLHSTCAHMTSSSTPTCLRLLCVSISDTPASKSTSASLCQCLRQRVSSASQSTSTLASRLCPHLLLRLRQRPHHACVAVPAVPASVPVSLSCGHLRIHTPESAHESAPVSKSAGASVSRRLPRARVILRQRLPVRTSASRPRRLRHVTVHRAAAARP